MSKLLKEVYNWTITPRVDKINEISKKLIKIENEFKELGIYEMKGSDGYSPKERIEKIKGSFQSLIKNYRSCIHSGSPLIMKIRSNVLELIEYLDRNERRNRRNDFLQRIKNLIYS
ncbi:MAG: hypothetical protein B6U78_00940 [Candidatus Aenigmarchaeota archaeon ex4484_224]|nr:MAG: hypothetical protein B6U78_00940 [Candidatus Aenigmarchaeota archaeon ex4484_224]